MTIAIELGVSRKAVRLACERHGLASQPDGPRRGVTTTGRPVERRALHPADVRYEQERKPRGPAPTREYLWARMRAAIQADAADDTLAFDDALLGVASAAKLLYDQRRRTT